MQSISGCRLVGVVSRHTTSHDSSGAIVLLEAIVDPVVSQRRRWWRLHAASQLRRDILVAVATSNEH